MLPLVGATSPQEGTASNRYAILGRIATGGMAEIFLARAISLAGVERHVVLKRVLPERTRDPQFVKMFLDEARLAAQLQHPNIAQVHDIGRLGDSYFFTMEYVHGEDLRAILQRLAALRRQAPVQHALLIAAGAAAALHHAHDRQGPDRKPLGIVHRDVSPSNVMVSFEGAVKLVDFGVAKATQRSTETRTGTVKGKIAYLSPEQCRGGPIDRRSDIFSLGIVLYELLTCTRLFRRETDFATMTAIVSDDAPPPSVVRPELAPEIDRVVLTALQRDPEKRYGSAGEMLEAIEAAAEACGKTLSAHALGRFLRELFGERPEPWMELEVSDDAPSLVTVTSQSVIGADALAGAAPLPSRMPSAIPTPHAEEVENELRRTAQLRKREPDGSDSGSSLPHVPTIAPGVPPPAPPAPAPPARWSGAIPLSPAPGSARTLVPGGAPPPASAPNIASAAASGPTPLPPPPAPGPSGPNIAVPNAVPVISIAPITTPAAGAVPAPIPTVPRSAPAQPPPVRPEGSSPPPFGAAGSSSGSQALPTTYPSYTGNPRRTDDERAAPARAPKRWVVILGVALGVIGIGVAIGAVLAQRDKPQARTTVADPAAAPAADPVDPAAAPAAAAVPDAAAAPAAAAVPDATPTPTPTGADDPIAATLAAISAAASTGDWSTVWKSCGTIDREDLSLDARAACAQAACVRKHRSDAIDLLRGLPKPRKAAIAKVCASKGIDVDGGGASAKDRCEENPLLCQH
jgi:serine/threonine protein kinase